MSLHANGADLIAGLRHVLDVARRAAEEMSEFAARIDPVAPDRAVLVAVGARITDFWEQMEKIAKRYVAEANGEVPSGGDWHRRLLERALPVPDRPGRLFPEDLREDLDHLLRFRHFFRHAYPVQLDWQKLRRNVERVVRVLPRIEREIDSL